MLRQRVHDAEFVLNCVFTLCRSKYVIIRKLAKVYMFRVFKIMYNLFVFKMFSHVLVIRFASYRKLPFCHFLSPKPVNCAKTDFLLD